MRSAVHEEVSIRANKCSIRHLRAGESKRRRSEARPARPRKAPTFLQ